MSVHHRWVTFFWKKNSRYENGTALKLCRHILWTFLRCPGQKKILHRTQRKIPSAKPFVYFFSDFSTWNASIGDVRHFLVGLIVVRQLFQCKATSETNQKWIYKGIKKKSSAKTFWPGTHTKTSQKRNFQDTFWTENYTHDSVIVVVHGVVLFFSFAPGSPKELFFC